MYHEMKADVDTAPVRETASIGRRSLLALGAAPGTVAQELSQPSSRSRSLEGKEASAPAGARAFSGGPPKRNSHVDLIQFVEAELRSHVAGELLKHLKKCSSALATRIERLQAINGRTTSTKDRIDDLMTIRTQAGVKPCSVGYDTPLLDSIAVRLQASTLIHTESEANEWATLDGTDSRALISVIYIATIWRSKSP